MRGEPHWKEHVEKHEKEGRSADQELGRRGCGVRKGLEQARNGLGDEETVDNTAGDTEVGGWK